MKKILLYLFTILLAAVACHKEYTIYPYAKFEQCLAPTEVRTKVTNMAVVFDWKSYPDAKSFYVEIYNAVPDDVDSPDPAALVDTLVVAPADVPFTYEGPEDTKCFFRVKARNPECKDSRWITGTFTTDTDPRYTCSLPTNVKALAICDMVVFSWEIAANTTTYELEVYDRFFPAEGEPDPANLVIADTLTRSEVPETLMLTPDVKLYFRVRATAPGTTLKNSKWVRGSFDTKSFTWPSDDTALSSTANTVQDYSGTCDDGTPSPFTGGGTTPADGHPITLNGFSYFFKCMYYGNRVTLASGAATDVSDEFGAPIPTKNYFCFKICKPGRFENFFTAAGEGAEAGVVLLTNKEGEGKVAKRIWQKKNLPVTATTGGLSKDIVTITEGDLYGIKEAATVYVHSSNQKGLHVFKLTWYPAN